MQHPSCILHASLSITFSRPFSRSPTTSQLFILRANQFLSLIFPYFLFLSFPVNFPMLLLSYSLFTWLKAFLSSFGTEPLLMY